ncbi:MAG: hypothetical protein MI799_12340 [Desulfobacterales bacterium]|nr:hypothetical protein [Desulfobacterales bacterium]
MRITDPQVIQDGEKDLIASVQKDLDLEAVKDLLTKRLTASALSPKGGRIVVHDNDVAFRLDYEINLDGSLLFDRNGNLLEDEEPNVPEQDLPDEDETSAFDLDDNLSIGLPDYDDALNEVSEEDQSEAPESGDSHDETQDAGPGFDIEGPEDKDDDTSEFDIDQGELDGIDTEEGDEEINDLPEDDHNIDVDELTNLALEDEGNEAGEEMVDSDIDDILQENRDFWEKKKD